MQKVISYIFFLLLLLMLPSCSMENEPQVISNLAYNSKSPNENIVYVRENDEYIPFIVASGDYDGNVLLVRSEILPSPRKINEYSGYYEDSNIDVYLNSDYYTDIAINDKIVTSKVIITDSKALGYSGNTTTTIDRKIFLLSLTEICVSDKYNSGVEGNPIPYFRESENRISYYQGQAMSWWLRTPDTYYLSRTYGVGPKGTVGSGNSYDENGVRPCFCVPAELEVTRRTDVVNDQAVYVLS